MWKNGKDVSKPETLAETLQSNFSPDETKTILSSANGAVFKQRLNDNTKEALDRGAFGAPWFWVRNGKGAEEPFFGSDRYATVQFRPLFTAGQSMSGKVSAPADGERVWDLANSVCVSAVKRRFYCRREVGANDAMPDSIICGSTWGCLGRMWSWYQKVSRKRRCKGKEAWEPCGLADALHPGSDSGWRSGSQRAAEAGPVFVPHTLRRSVTELAVRCCTNVLSRPLS